MLRRRAIQFQIFPTVQGEVLGLVRFDLFFRCIFFQVRGSYKQGYNHQQAQTGIGLIARHCKMKGHEPRHSA